jgi:tRNA threonylcarbamoyladenosine biosynthesis protein TsaE
MSTIQLESHSEAENLEVAKKILKSCKNMKIFALYGYLGAGKTTLIKSFCEALGVTGLVTSPTFNLVNEYQGEESVVYHFDFYRIKDETEAYDIGSDEYFDSEGYCFIEWPEKIPTLLPPEAVEIHIHVGENESRQIDVTY